MPQDIISQFTRKYNAPIETARAVTSIALRDSILSSIRWAGMLVYVVNEQTTYELRGGIDNTDWEPLTGLSDAPEDGQYYVRKDAAWELLPASLTPIYGTFTPVLTDLGGGGTYSVGTVSANYAKLGKLVFFTVTLGTISTTGAPSGGLVITGLPFVSLAGSANTSFPISWFRLSNASDSNLNKIGAYIGQGSATLIFTNKVGALTSITFTSPGAIQVSGTYLTD